MIALKLEAHSVFSGVSLFHSEMVKILQSSSDRALMKCCWVSSFLNTPLGNMTPLLLDISPNAAISAIFLKIIIIVYFFKAFTMKGIEALAYIPNQLENWSRLWKSLH